MSGFKFPPPPPPPPRTSTASHEANRSQHAGQERGRGPSRGRNHCNNRGRGDRGGSYRRHQNEHNHYSGNAFNNTGSNHTGFQGPNPLTFSNQSGSLSNFDNLFNGLPPGSHVNPSFMPGFSQRSSLQLAPSSNATTHPPRTLAGHKRKLEALRGPQPQQKKNGPPTAPSVPSFGASILTSSRGNTALPPRSNARNASSKPWSNNLGLTPGSKDPQYSSSDEDDDDVDEEAMHAELGTTLTFEHNGVVMSLNSVADLAVWSSERKKNWPTQQAMALKLEKKRKTGEIRNRLVADAIAVLIAAQAQKRPQTTLDVKTTSRVEITERDEKKPPSNDKLSLPEVRSEQGPFPNGTVSPGHANDADGTRNESNDRSIPKVEEIDEPNGVDDEPESVMLSESSGEESTDSSSDESDDDGPPEEQHSKLNPPTDHQKRVCRYFSASGYCRDGDSCRFRHEQPSRDPKTAPSPRPARQQPAQEHLNSQKEDETIQGSSGILKLLTEKDQDDEDILALQAIKFLGESGFFRLAEPNSES